MIKNSKHWNFPCRKSRVIKISIAPPAAGVCVCLWSCFNALPLGRRRSAPRRADNDIWGEKWLSKRALSNELCSLPVLRQHVYIFWPSPPRGGSFAYLIRDLVEHGRAHRRSILVIFWALRAPTVRIWPTIEFDSPQRFAVKVLCKSISWLALESLRFCAQSGLSCTAARVANVFVSLESEIREMCL